MTNQPKPPSDKTIDAVAVLVGFLSWCTEAPNQDHPVVQNTRQLCDALSQTLREKAALEAKVSRLTQCVSDTCPNCGYPQDKAQTTIAAMREERDIVLEFVPDDMPTRARLAARLVELDRRKAAGNTIPFEAEMHRHAKNAAIRAGIEAAAKIVEDRACEFAEYGSTRHMLESVARDIRALPDFADWRKAAGEGG